jgi:alcohol dehydrogenase (quinone), cytochrome c subunit
MRWKVLLPVLGLGGLCGLFGMMGVASILDGAAGEKSLEAPAPNATLIDRGAYLARLGDCAACHSGSGQPAFSGGYRFATPIGGVYSTNITPDPTYGIGRFTLADFDRALRFGVADGHSLYPAMPFSSYANTKPEDVAALYIYFKYGVAPAATPNVANDIPFPLSMRWPLTFWRLLFAPRPEPFIEQAGADPVLTRGAYLVEGLGHCGECHTPRNLTLQVRAQKASDGSIFLSGAAVDTYFAPNLRQGGADTLGDWTEGDIVDFLKTGANPRGIVFGSMTDVIVHSTQFITRDDALAIAKYLKALSDPPGPSTQTYAYDDSEHAALKRGDASKTGAGVYIDNCAACHRPDGLGYERVFPRLAGNPVVEASNSASLISIVLTGSRTPRTPETPAQFSMPAFAWRLNDQNVADVINFIRSSWGNSASKTSASDVAAFRKTLVSSGREDNKH